MEEGTKRMKGGTTMNAERNEINAGRKKGRETNNDVIYAPRNTQVTRASARTMAHSQVERA